MNIHKIIITLLTLSVFLLGVTAVGAQDTGAEDSDRPSGPIREVLNIVAEEIGVEPRDILAQMRNGLTFADIITTSGGDVNQVVAQSVAQLTADINQAVADGRITQERADRLLTNLEDVVTRGINGELFPNRLDRGAVRRGSERILVQTVADATGLLAPEVLAQLQSGQTLADIITANGGDVEAVVDSAVAAAIEQINAAVADGRLGQEQADELIANLPEVYAGAVNGDLRQERLENRIARGVLGLAAEQTGLQPVDITRQLRDGKSLADILTENNVDTSVSP